MLRNVPNWFLTPKTLDNANLVNDEVGKIMTWYNEYKQRKACKKEICKALMSIAWHSKIGECQKKEKLFSINFLRDFVFYTSL